MCEIVFAFSVIHDVPGWTMNGFTRAVTSNWSASAIVQLQTGFPMTISVFGDTANSGDGAGENPVRANLTGKPIFGPGTRNATTWFNLAAFAAPPAYTITRIWALRFVNTAGFGSITEVTTPGRQIQLSTTPFVLNEALSVSNNRENGNKGIPSELPARLVDAYRLQNRCRAHPAYFQ